MELNRVICGDALEELRKMPDDSVDLVVTDPPYGVDYEGWDGDIPPREVIDELRRVCKGTILWFGGARTDVMKRTFDEYPLPDRIIVWHTPFSLGFTRKNKLMFKWHPIYCWNMTDSNHLKRDEIGMNTGGRNWWNHPATKPVELLKELILSFSNEGDTVLDIYAGSGSTAVAAKETGRGYVMVEINPEYCEVIHKRTEGIQKQVTL